MSLSSNQKHWLVWLGGGVAVAWVVAVFWWWLLEPTTADEVKELVIPEGTAAAIADGRTTTGIPSDFSLGRSGEVLIINQDVAEHYIGGALIRPGATLLLKPQDKEGEVLCTFHPTGSIGFTLDERPSILVTIIPALLLGVPFGLAFGGATYIAQRLGMHEDEPQTL